MKPCYCPNSSRQSRKTWIRRHGAIPEGMQVLHTCDNVLCIEDDHLYLGTAQQNTQDMFDRGRNGSQKMIKITDEIIDRYLAGENTADLAKEIGVHRNSISWAARNRFDIRVGSGCNYA